MKTGENRERGEGDRQAPVLDRLQRDDRRDLLLDVEQARRRRDQDRGHGQKDTHGAIAVGDQLMNRP